MKATSTILLKTKKIKMAYRDFSVNLKDKWHQYNHRGRCEHQSYSTTLHCQPVSPVPRKLKSLLKGCRSAGEKTLDTATFWSFARSHDCCCCYFLFWIQ